MEVRFYFILQDSKTSLKKVKISNSENTNAINYSNTNLRWLTFVDVFIL